MANDPEKLNGEDYSSFLKPSIRQEEAITARERENFDRIVNAAVNQLRNASNQEIQRVLMQLAHSTDLTRDVGYALSHQVTKRIEQELEKIRQARKK